MNYGRNSGIGFFGVVGIVLLIAIAVAACFALGAWLVMLAWGGVAGIFGFMTITYVQALSVELALWIISGVLKGVSYTKKSDD
uniref:Uncharacterized protein n=1 Tax=viral metagenome TaxID=1070528 RepID=A0A6M3LG59_9ZZZZ